MVLEEVTDHVVGVALWRALQDVRLWASAPPEWRRELFRGELARVQGAAPDVEVCLLRLEHLLRDPEMAGERAVSRLCLQVSEWAERHRALGTALAFAEAATLVSDTNALYAYRAGKLARKRAEYPRAEVWFRRALTLGRRSKDWESLALAFAGLGNLYRQKGDTALALHFHTRSLRVARRRRLRNLHGDALHNLCVISLEAGDTENGYLYAREALRVYGSEHPHLPILAQDLAWFWMTQTGAYTRALRIFQELLRHIWEPALRLCVLTNIARAAGGAGIRPEFEMAWNDAWAMMQRMPDREGHAASLLHLAYGAAGIGDWARARTAAELACKIAVERQEERITGEAEQFRQALGDSLRAESRSFSFIPRLSTDPDQEADDLAKDLLKALRRAALS